ncbi:hypothetical protein CRV08_02005 [Halarcobacter ebronensis]|uniref:Uncharacterized protein n=1 Tax=Halarcobacter ebronensis TaxID=1462615 RepID=A0A4Q0YK10_9BACT|nr:hypothetical protein [Halarcobacter ebronensis]RXJ69499.1 hypothetical protein CRV08_02005 [Halarcobacter ebronensis]
MDNKLLNDFDELFLNPNHKLTKKQLFKKNEKYVIELLNRGISLSNQSIEYGKKYEFISPSTYVKYTKELFPQSLNKSMSKLVVKKSYFKIRVFLDNYTYSKNKRILVSELYEYLKSEKSLIKIKILPNSNLTYDEFETVFYELLKGSKLEDKFNFREDLKNESN